MQVLAKNTQKILAQYPEIESIGSKESILLGIFGGPGMPYLDGVLGASPCRMADLKWMAPPSLPSDRHLGPGSHSLIP